MPGGPATMKAGPRVDAPGPGRSPGGAWFLPRAPQRRKLQGPGPGGPCTGDEQTGPSTGFTVSGFRFQSLTHFELIFCMVEDSGLVFQFIEEILRSPLYSLCSSAANYLFPGLFLGSLFCFVHPRVCFSASITLC